MDANGRQDDQISVVYGSETEVYYSCSIAWQNQFYIFGGKTQKQQISKLVGCELSRVGTLDFDHYLGGCTNIADNQVYLCFNAAEGNNYKKCRVASGPLGNFDEISQSAFPHRYTQVASSNSKFPSTVDLLKIWVWKKNASGWIIHWNQKFLADLLVVGSYDPYNVKTERYKIEVGQWVTVDDYPFVSESNDSI